MKKVIDNIKIDNYTSKTFEMYFGGKICAIFDIETTGLSPSCCGVILSGILIPCGSKCKVIQLFSDTEDDEEAIIRETFNILKSVDYIVTFNGKHFDIPFINKRAHKLGIGTEIQCYNLDLYLLLNGHSDLRRTLPNLKQKTVEVYMGLSDQRCDTISGKESVDMYHMYMNTHSIDLEKKILLHNHDDIIQLYKLLPIINQTDFHQAMSKLGFPTDKFIIDRISFSGHDLVITGLQTSFPIDYISFPTEEKPYKLSLNKKQCSMELIIPCIYESDAIYFDAQALLGDVTVNIEKYPSVVNGYLIVREGGIMHYMEVNAFLIELFKSIEINR